MAQDVTGNEYAERRQEFWGMVIKVVRVLRKWWQRETNNKARLFAIKKVKNNCKQSWDIKIREEGESQGFDNLHSNNDLKCQILVINCLPSTTSLLQVH